MEGMEERKKRKGLDGNNGKIFGSLKSEEGEENFSSDQNKKKKGEKKGRRDECGDDVEENER